VRDGASALIEEGTAEEVFENPREDLTRAYVTGLRG
jgi:ABC-type phosphate transport system ATPase subunit